MSLWREQLVGVWTRGERGVGLTLLAVAGRFLGRLVDDRRVLEAAQVEHPDAAVGAAGAEDVDAAG